MSVRRTGAFYHGDMIFIDKPDHIRLIHIKKRSDHGDFRPVQIRDRAEGMKPSLINQRHQHGFHHIVLVVRVGHLIAAFLFYGIVQRALTHFRAERTGIAFLPLLKDHIRNIRPDNSIRDLKLVPANAFDPAQIQVMKAQVHRYSVQLKMLRIKPLQPVQGIQKCQGILASRYPYRDPVALLDHMIIIRSPADIA